MQALNLLVEAVKAVLENLVNFKGKNLQWSYVLLKVGLHCARCFPVNLLTMEIYLGQSIQEWTK